ncbi:hypothetical protein FQN57_005710 [Myotisia sp. PD_48]|nr:hypothetical protein FQN57_005710 [Myotisia sp. PD_48]
MRSTTLAPLLRTATKPLSTTTCLNTPAQSRNFNLPSLSSFAPPLSTPEPRTLTASRTLPFPPLPLFRTISAIQSYGDFLPFLTASKVTARDRISGYPTRAYLTVGYGPLSETFESQVECSEEKWLVGARSGDISQQIEKNQNGASGESIFEYLDTIWKLDPMEKSAIGMERTKVELTVRYQFRSALHAAMMAAVEGQVAGMMVEAFEKRMREVETRTL